MSATYTQVKVKCLVCGLHAVLATNDPDQHTCGSLWCPGCGQHTGAFAVWREEVSGYIWQLVPSEATLVEVRLG